jgi:hypothetical protein
VRHVVDRVVAVDAFPSGDIRAVRTAEHGEISGDLFIDCSGLAALLIGKHFGVPFVERRSVLLNDTALAVQVPYTEPDSPIAAYTQSTARSGGWIWDIGLSSRRGVGYVYSSGTAPRTRRVPYWRRTSRQGHPPSCLATKPGGSILCLGIAEVFGSETVWLSACQPVFWSHSRPVPW